MGTKLYSHVIFLIYFASTADSVSQAKKIVSNRNTKSVNSNESQPHLASNQAIVCYDYTGQVFLISPLLSFGKKWDNSLFRLVTNFVQQTWWPNCGSKALTTRLSPAALTAFGFSMVETVSIMPPLYRLRYSWWKCWRVHLYTQESWWGFGSSYCTDVPTQFRNRASSLRLKF